MKSVSPLSFKNPGEAIKAFKKGDFKGERVRAFPKGSEEFLNDFFSVLAKAMLKENFSRDEIIVQTVKYYDELNTTLNSLFERVYEWFTLAIPEASKMVENPEKFYSVVSKVLGSADLVPSIKRELKIKEAYGGALTAADLASLKSSLSFFITVYKERDSVKKYIDDLVTELAPNLAAVATPQLGAKLMSVVGGLERLASVPASTIQVLGAEKALFRHLIKGTKPPKHGLIIQHPFVQGAGRKFKGKVARFLANKISLAAKVDFYGGDKNGSLGKAYYNELKRRSEALK